MKSFVVILVVAMLHACQKPSSEQPTNPSPAVSVAVPDFSADSAYTYIARQVAFGPRVPNTPSHLNCAAYLVMQLQQHGAVVTEQQFQARAFNGTLLNGINIIGSFLPDATKRVLLFAHWDTRPWSDHDPNPANYNVPVTGANDGASGVGVLLEIARHLGLNTPAVGVDIIFFDAEDYGAPVSFSGNDQDSWALGSQHWSRNPHQKGYRAAYGILLDMVGAAGATFYKEQISTFYAPDIVQKVWNTARHLGFQRFFIDKPGGYITDDHLYVNRLAGIPSINIIHYDPTSENGFFEHWHTVNDTMENIDRETLYAVGTTLLHVIYNER